MRSDVIVLPEPLIDDGLCLFGGGEPLCVEYLFAQRPVESLVVTVLPR